MFELLGDIKNEIMLRTQIIKLHNAGFLDRKETDMLLYQLLDSRVHLAIAEFLEFLTSMNTGDLINEVRETILDSGLDIKFFDENDKEIPKEKLEGKRKRGK